MALYMFDDTSTAFVAAAPLGHDRVGAILRASISTSLFAFIRPQTSDPSQSPSPTCRDRAYAMSIARASSTLRALNGLSRSVSVSIEALRRVCNHIFVRWSALCIVAKEHSLITSPCTPMYQDIYIHWRVGPLWEAAVWWP
ncbi:unnamed protein product [Clonostachys chloroleuca]|uniref:Uncharacterized protein n=1 Tax=Clonostachys chloroleuca TaxID=1926264 RepID=A0AA35MGY3_9HYPO|nr:unnamed protein product [Clonostachys chloroleuca]